MLFLPQRIWISPIILFFLILEKLLCYIIFNLKYIIMQSDINKYSVNPKGNQSWIFTGKTYAETPILWPPDLKNRCIGKDPDAGKDWRQERRRGQRMRWLDGITEWTWAWASFGCRSWTGSPGVLRSRGSQRVGHDWVTELNWGSFAYSVYYIRIAKKIENRFAFCAVLSHLSCTQLSVILWI